MPFLWSYLVLINRYQCANLLNINTGSEQKQSMKAVTAETAATGKIEKREGPKACMKTASRPLLRPSTVL